MSNPEHPLCQIEIPSLEFNFADVMPQMNVRQDSSLFGFYVYIALLALVLLGLDYWLRKKYIWK